MLKSVLLLICLCVVMFSFTGCSGCTCTPKPTTPAQNAAWQCASLEGDDQAYQECLDNAN